MSNMECDDPYDPGSRVFPRPFEPRQSESLAPTPPQSWLIASQLWGDGSDQDREVGIWVEQLRAFQGFSTSRAKRHMVCRYPNGGRALLIHPDLLEEANHLADYIDCHMQECCGGSCLGGDVAQNSFWVLGKKRWSKLAFNEQLQLGLAYDIDPSIIAAGVFQDILDADDSGELANELIYA